jgi:hypothetical protein
MSSPMHFDDDVDPALMYAPPWAREQVTPGPSGSAAPMSDLDEPGRGFSGLDPKFSGDRAMLELQRQLALNPDLIPEPAPEANAVMRPLLIRFCSVVALAAVIAWGVVSYPGVKKGVEMLKTDVSTPAIATSQAKPVRLEAAQSPSSATQANASAPTVSKPPSVAAPVAVASADAVPVIAAPAPAAPPASVAAPETAGSPPPPPRPNDRSVAQVVSEEVAMLVKRGKDFLADGDIASARLLLRRAAEAGSAEGALTLGTTFDPTMILRLGAIGAKPDMAEARHWYQRAAELGSSAASQQLAGLGGDH